MPKLDWIDKLLLERLRDAGTCKTWSLLNSIVDEQNPRDRTDGRLQRLRLLDRVKRLRALGLIFSVGRNNISDTKPSKRRSTIRRRRPTVANTASILAVSAPAKSSAHEAQRQGQQAQDQLNKGVSSPNSSAIDVAKTKSAEEAQRISQAASALARLPRNQNRRYTGWLRGKHCWRGRLLVLPNGEIAPLLWCSRGKVVLSGYRYDPLVDKHTEFLNYLRWVARREADVRLHKSPQAVLLGSRKSGIKEHPSLRKQEAARANGSMPTRRGRRGRPKKFTSL